MAKKRHPKNTAAAKKKGAAGAAATAPTASPEFGPMSRTAFMAWMRTRSPETSKNDVERSLDGFTARLGELAAASLLLGAEDDAADRQWQDVAVVAKWWRAVFDGHSEQKPVHGPAAMSFAIDALLALPATPATAAVVTARTLFALINQCLSGGEKTNRKWLSAHLLDGAHAETRLRPLLGKFLLGTGAPNPASLVLDWPAQEQLVEMLYRVCPKHFPQREQYAASLFKKSAAANTHVRPAFLALSKLNYQRQVVELLLTVQEGHRANEAAVQSAAVKSVSGVLVLNVDGVVVMEFVPASSSSAIDGEDEQAVTEIPYSHVRDLRLVGGRELRIHLDARSGGQDTVPVVFAESEAASAALALVKERVVLPTSPPARHSSSVVMQPIDLAAPATPVTPEQAAVEKERLMRLTAEQLEKYAAAAGSSQEQQATAETPLSPVRRAPRRRPIDADDDLSSYHSKSTKHSKSIISKVIDQAKEEEHEDDSYEWDNDADDDDVSEFGSEATMTSAMRTFGRRKRTPKPTPKLNVKSYHGKKEEPKQQQQVKEKPRTGKEHLSRAMSVPKRRTSAMKPQKPAAAPVQEARRQPRATTRRGAASKRKNYREQDDEEEYEEEAGAPLMDGEPEEEVEYRPRKRGKWADFSGESAPTATKTAARKTRTQQKTKDQEDSGMVMEETGKMFMQEVEYREQEQEQEVRAPKRQTKQRQPAPQPPRAHYHQQPQQQQHHHHQQTIPQMTSTTAVNPIALALHALNAAAISTVTTQSSHMQAIHHQALIEQESVVHTEVRQFIGEMEQQWRQMMSRVETKLVRVFERVGREVGQWGREVGTVGALGNAMQQ